MTKAIKFPKSFTIDPKCWGRRSYVDHRGHKCALGFLFSCVKAGSIIEKVSALNCHSFQCGGGWIIPRITMANDELSGMHRRRMLKELFASIGIQVKFKK